jgi:hypothetical protein
MPLTGGRDVNSAWLRPNTGSYQYFCTPPPRFSSSCKRTHLCFISQRVNVGLSLLTFSRKYLISRNVIKVEELMLTAQYLKNSLLDRHQIEPIKSQRSNYPGHRNLLTAQYLEILLFDGLYSVEDLY